MAESQVQQFFSKMIGDQSTRVESMMGEFARAEQKGTEQAKHVMDEWTKLVNASISYSIELGDQWRKLSLEATRRAFEMVTPKG